jgi:hypothetical protein
MLDGGIIQRLLEEKWKTFARVSMRYFIVDKFFASAFYFNYTALLVIFNKYHILLINTLVEFFIIIMFTD